MKIDAIAAVESDDYNFIVADAPKILVEKIFISPGHNFFGHHDKPAGKNPLVEISQIECVAGRGLVGDRFFDFKRDYKGQITFFSAEVFEEVCHTLGVSGKSPGVTRRNVITRGVNLNALIGKEFEIQGINFLGISECTPCYWMDEAIGPGAERCLQKRGGLRAKILSDGILRVST